MLNKENMAFMNNERKFEFRFRFHEKESSKKKEYIELKTPVERKNSSIVSSYLLHSLDKQLDSGPSFSFLQVFRAKSLFLIGD